MAPDWTISGILAATPATSRPNRSRVRRSGPWITRWTGAAAVAITSDPISLICSRRMPGMVATACFCIPSITCQMVRLRLSLSLKLSIIEAAFTCGTW